MSDEESSIPRTPRSRRVHSLELCLKEIRNSLDMYLSTSNRNLASVLTTTEHASIVEHILHKIDCVFDSSCSLITPSSQGRKRTRTTSDNQLIPEVEQMKTTLSSEAIQRERMENRYQEKLQDKDREIEHLKHRLAQLSTLESSVRDELAYNVDRFNASQREMNIKIRSLEDQLRQTQSDRDNYFKKSSTLENDNSELLKQLNVERDENDTKIQLMQERYRAKLQNEKDSGQLQLEIIQNELKKSKYNAETSAKKLKESQEIVDQASDIRELRKELETRRCTQRRLEKKVNELSNSIATAAIQKEKNAQLQEKIERLETREQELLVYQEECRNLVDEKKEWKEIFEAYAASSLGLTNLINNAPAKAAMLLYKNSQNEQSLLVETQGRLRTRIHALEKKLQETSSQLLDEAKRSSELDTKVSQLEYELENSTRRVKILELDKQDLWSFLESYGHEASMLANSNSAGHVERIQQLELKLQDKDAELSMAQQANQHQPSPIVIKKYSARINELEFQLKSKVCENVKLQQDMEKITAELMEKTSRLSRGVSSTKVLHLRNNPMSESKDYQIQQLKEEIQRLHQLTDISGNMSTDDGMQRIDYKKQYEVLYKRFRVNQDRLKAIFYQISGYRIDADYKINSDEQEVVRLRLMYAENPDDDIKFILTKDNELQLVETEYMSRLDSHMKSYIIRFKSIPCFMASLLLNLHDNQTFRE